MCVNFALSYVKLWDMRNLSYHLCSLPFPGCVTGAYFSPVCGSKLLVTTLSNTIRYMVIASVYVHCMLSEDCFIVLYEAQNLIVAVGGTFATSMASTLNFDYGNFSPTL